MLILNEELIRAVDDIRDILGDSVAEDLPHIAVIGEQSSGKSSVLESIVGQDFLPRGEGTVTKRPLLLQLMPDNTCQTPIGVFSHKPKKQFENFDEIKAEIIKDTEKEMNSNNNNIGVSRKPIQLTIRSANTLRLTLVDLPGVTKVAVGDQPDDIENKVIAIIKEYISKDNCIILAVTPSTQELPASDAMKLAKEVDPMGARTIGVITKLDVSDNLSKTIDALNGKHGMHWKGELIGVVNRSQLDINSNKDIRKALFDEKKFFQNRPEFGPILANRMGIEYLRLGLQTVLASRIADKLGPFRKELDNKARKIYDDLCDLPEPTEGFNKHRLVSTAKGGFRKQYELAVGSKIQNVSFDRRSWGAKIHVIMMNDYGKQVDDLTYDSDLQEKEIATGLLNYTGTQPGIFPPDDVVRECARRQIDDFRDPSIQCVQSVADYIKMAIEDCVNKIECLPMIKDIFREITIDFVEHLTRKCKQSVKDWIETEKSFINTKNIDYLQKVGSIMALGVMGQRLGAAMAAPPATGGAKHQETWPNVTTAATLVANATTAAAFVSPMVANVATAAKIVAPVVASVSGLSATIRSFTVGNNQDMASAEDCPENVLAVKNLVNCYIDVLKKKFKDHMPKLCQIGLVDSTHEFIDNQLMFSIENKYNSIEDIVLEDPTQQLRLELSEKYEKYNQSIAKIDEFYKINQNINPIKVIQTKK